MLQMHSGFRPADHQTVTYRWRLADYAQQFWHHATQLGRWWRFKEAYFQKEAVKIS
jgi:hypothetical protein